MHRKKSITPYDFEDGESRSVRAFLISDHRLLIDAFVDLTRNREDFSITGSSPELVLSQANLKKVSATIDLFLIDSAGKPADALEVTRRLKEQLPESKIVILGLEHNEDLILRFVEAGAVGYLLKQASLAEISKTITAIHNGQSPCSLRVTATLFNKMAQLARHQREMTSAHRVSLTDREKEILRLMSVGLNNKDIARYLNIAFHTVKNHSHNILKKFHVHNRREAIGVAYKRGIIEKTLHSSMGLLPVFILLAESATGLDINSLANRFMSLF